MPPLSPICFHFHTVLGKNMPNHRLDLSGVSAPIWKILDPPLIPQQVSQSSGLPSVV